MVLTCCDSTPLLVSDTDPVAQLTDFQIDPGDIQFDRVIHGVTDTMLTFRISVSHHGTKPDVTPQFVLRNDGSNNALQSGFMSVYDENTKRFSGSFQFSTNTNLFHELNLLVFAASESELSNRINRKISIKGIPGSNPEILDATINPNPVTLPSAGSILVIFNAKIADDDGIDNIRSVYFRMESLNTGPLGSAFMMKPGVVEDGYQIYADTLTITSTNNPDRIRVTFFAEDKSDLQATAVERILEIVR